MYNRLLYVAASFLITGILFSSCRKPNDPAPQVFTGCRVTAITDVGYDTVSDRNFWHFYYTNEGDLQRIVSRSNIYYMVGGTRFFYYHPRFTLARDIYEGQTVPTSYDSLALDQQNRVTAIVRSYGSYTYPSIGLSQTFAYDANGSMVARASQGNGETTDSMTWIDGDLVKDVSYASGSRVDSTFYTYSDTLYQMGSSTASVEDLEKYGRKIYTNRHLCTSSHHLSSGVLLRYAYEVDSHGNITRIITRPDGTGQLETYRDVRITYACQ